MQKRAIWSVKKLLQRLVSLLMLSFLCSCATQKIERNFEDVPLPPETDINETAGKRGFLIVSFRMEDGEELPMLIDTGSPVTYLDKSLAARLEKSIGTVNSWMLDTASNTVIAYHPAPKLFLGGTPLKTGPNVALNDCKDIVSDGSPVLGILGMDCLKHYCLQMDFEKHKLRFLDTRTLDTNDLGRAYPLDFSSLNQSDGNYFCPYIQKWTLINHDRSLLLIDSGCDVDGGLKPASFKRMLDKHETALTYKTRNDTHQYASLTEDIWNGGIYTNVVILKVPQREPNLIGLRFLARHLVTFDFPRRIMYLKQFSTVPLDDHAINKAALDAELKSASDFLKELRQKSELPGWARDDKGNDHVDLHFDYSNSYPLTVTFEGRKKVGPALYHYTVKREAKESPWKLIKAWRTFGKPETTEEFPVPKPEK